MNLPKMKRKNLQVENAPHKSDRAKLVKLADKIYNLRDLNLSTPKGWTAQRVEEYFEWAEKVTNGCKGVNDKLDQILVDLYAARKQ